MHEIFYHKHVVLDREIDGQGHASNIAYVSWMQDAAIAHSSANGWTPERYRERGEGWVARSHFIEYLQPAFEADQLVVETWVNGWRNVSSTRRYEIRNTTTSDVLAKAETRWAYVNFEKGRPCPIPPEVRDAFIVLKRD